MYERCRAFLAVGRGLPDEAGQWIALTLERSRAMGARWEELEARRAAGIVALLAGDPEGAVDGLRTVWEHTVREQVDEPGAFPAARISSRRSSSSARSRRPPPVTDRLGRLADHQEHPWASRASGAAPPRSRSRRRPTTSGRRRELEAAADD